MSDSSNVGLRLSSGRHLWRRALVWLIQAPAAVVLAAVSLLIVVLCVPLYPLGVVAAFYQNRKEVVRVKTQYPGWYEEDDRVEPTTWGLFEMSLWWPLAFWGNCSGVLYDLVTWWQNIRGQFVGSGQRKAPAGARVPDGYRVDLEHGTLIFPGGSPFVFDDVEPPDKGA